MSSHTNIGASRISLEIRQFLHKEAELAGCAWSNVGINRRQDSVELTVSFQDKEGKMCYGSLIFDEEAIAAMGYGGYGNARRQLVRKELADLIRPWRGTKSSIKALAENPPEWGEYGY